MSCPVTARISLKRTRWLRPAAESGYGPAMLGLSTLYATGSGVPEDDSEGYAWINLAVDRNTKGAKPIRDRLVRSLSLDAFARASRRYAAYRHRY